MSGFDGLGEEKTENSERDERFLVLTLDKNGKIIYLNEEFENVTGFLKTQIVEKQFDLLIPSSYFEKWAIILSDVKKGIHTNDFFIPVLGRDGREIMVSWDIAPVDPDPESKQGFKIGLIGKTHRSEGVFKTETEKKIEQRIEDILSQVDSEEEKLTELIEGKKPWSFNDAAEQENRGEAFKKPLLVDRAGELKRDEQVYRKLREKYNPRNLSKTYRRFYRYNEIIRELKKENKKLEAENAKLRGVLKKLGKKLSVERKRFEEIKSKQRDLVDLRRFVNNKLSLLMDLLNFDEKKKEFEKMKAEIDQGLKELERVQMQINDDKRIINENRRDLIRWREKLELLEEEIEVRRSYFSDFVKNIREQHLDKTSEVVKTRDVQDEETGLNEDDLKRFLQENPDGVAVVQRGVFKLVNDPFAKLLGFETDDLLEKSFFNFVSTKGLKDVEDYYLRRLKGDETSTYNTTLVTNDEKEVNVKIDVKTVFHMGEKADMLIVHPA